MRAIWKEYGHTLLYIMAVAAVIWMTVAMVGKKWGAADTKRFETDYIREAGNVQLEAAVGREEPSIIYLSGNKIWIGQNQELADSFRAVDADGKVLAVEIVDVRNAQGESCAYPFTEAGSYQIKVKAEDSLHKCTQLIFRVPVNRGDI